MHDADRDSGATMGRIDTLTWIGHATVLVRVGGLRILTDPALTPTIAHLRRRRPAPAVGPVDVVAVSHVHMDHLHRPSLRRVATGRTRLIVPVGALGLVSGIGAGRIDEVEAGDAVELDGGHDRVLVEAVPAVHGAGRGPHSRVVAAPVGYVVSTPRVRLYFAGDTGLFDEMAEIGPVDVALLPIWGWGPALGEGHLDPEAAAEATQRLQARHVIAIHWGTYSPVRPAPGRPAWLDRPIGAFGTALAARGLAGRLVELWPGESAAIHHEHG